MSTCSFEGCDKPIMGKGLCAGHYHQQRRGQELRPLRKRTSPKETMSTCSFEGCDKPIMGKGLCAGHYHQQRRGQELRPLRKRTSPETERLRAHGLRKCTECG